MITILIEEFIHFQKTITFPEYQNNRTPLELGNTEKVDISYKTKEGKTVRWLQILFKHLRVYPEDAEYSHP